MAEDDDTCDSIAADVGLCQRRTNVNCKSDLYKLVIYSHFSRHVQIWPRVMSYWLFGLVRHVAACCCENKTSGWRRGVVVTELVVSTKLLYAEPG